MNRLSLIAFVLVGISSQADATQVAITLKDGGKFIGKLDKRTDQRRVWLRYQRGSTTLLRPISWTRISRVERNSLPLNRIQVALLADKAGGNPVDITTKRSDVAAHARAALGFTPKIRRVHLKATTTDKTTGKRGSLLVCLKARGCVPAFDKEPQLKESQLVRGILTVSWKDGRKIQGQTWVRRIDLHRFHSSAGALVHLPFNEQRPREGTELKIKFVVPGHGTFNYSFEYSEQSE